MIDEIIRFFTRDLINISIYTMTLSAMLTPKLNKKIQLPCFLLIMVAFVQICDRTLPAESIVRMAYLVTYAGLILSYCLFFHKDKKFKCLLAFVLLMVIIMLGDMMTSFTMSYFFGPDIFGPEAQNQPQFIGFLLCNIYLAFLSFVAVQFWKKFSRELVSKSIFLFFLFPISQYLLIMGYIQIILSHKLYSNYLNNIWILLGVMVSFTADFFAFRGLVQNSQSQKMKLRLEAMEYQQQTQFHYYEKLREKNLEMAKLRHDFGNVIAAAEALKVGGETEGEQMLSELQKRISETKAPYYCSNTVANTVIWDKSRTAAEKKIDFSAEVSLPETIHIESVDLCCLLANLLDNAIEGAEKSEEKTVTLRCRYEGERLFVLVKNSADKAAEGVKQPPKTTKPDKAHHGYGMTIISNIAEKYQGEFAFDCSAGTFSSAVSLLNVG